MTILLVPLDGSDKDERAESVATALATLTGAAQRQVHLPADVDVPAKLLEMAHDPEVVLVVMATRAPGALDDALHGSVAKRLVLESPCPVVVVPPRAQHLRGRRLELRRVLVPLDGSQAALAVIEHLLTWARAADLEIVLLHVVQPEPTGGYLMPPDSSATNDEGWVHVNAERAEGRLKEVADRLRTRGVRAEVRVVESVQPATVINTVVREELVDFVAMRTRGTTGLRRLILGSVAKVVVRASELPVLLVTT